MNNHSAIDLPLPEHDLASFSLFELNESAAQRWAQNLPVASPEQSTDQLRIAIEQLNRVEITPPVRFQIMEALQPNLAIELSNLAKYYLKQPLTLPDEPQKMAASANTLCELCTTAYTLVAIQSLQQSPKQGHKQTTRVCMAIEKAISYTSRKILLAYQLYCSVEAKDWTALHQLYVLAEREGLATTPIVERVSEHTTSIAESYLQSCLLACCKPNQLQQKDLGVIYRGLALWSKRVQIVPADESGLFQLDLDSDRPPGYSALSANPKTKNTRLLDTTALIQQLKELKAQDLAAGRPGIKFDRNTTLPSSLLDHLINALGVMTKRNFARRQDTGTLDVSLGLSNCHFYIAKNQDFEQVIYGTSTESSHEHAARFLAESRHHDMWEAANPHEILDDHHILPENADIEVDAETLAIFEHEDETGKSDLRFPRYPVEYINSSPSGYCLSWSNDLPQNIKAGEIISVREGSSQDWIIAVTRWVSKLGEDRTLVGIELLSPSAMPYGAKVQQTETRQAEALSRALLLPEIKLIGQASTLITPRTGFKEKQKVQLVRASEHFNVQLTRQVAATPGYSQFEFRYIKVLEDIITENKDASVVPTYNSMWNNL